MYDAQGHADLAAALDTPSATGEMLTSFGEHAQLIKARASDLVQPDAPPVGGITPFLQITQVADDKALAASEQCVVRMRDASLCVQLPRQQEPHHHVHRA